MERFEYSRIKYIIIDRIQKLEKVINDLTIDVMSNESSPLNVLEEMFMLEAFSKRLLDIFRIYGPQKLCQTLKTLQNLDLMVSNLLEPHINDIIEYCKELHSYTTRVEVQGNGED